MFLGVASASPWPKARLIEATTIRAPILGPVGIVCSSYDTSVCADITRFFRPDKTQIARVTLVTALSPRLGFRVQLTEAVEAPKVSIQEKLLFGLLYSRTHEGGRTVMYEVYSSIGGNLEQRPCVDSYAREYHCSTLTAWSDYPRKSIRFPEYGVRVNVRF